MTAMMQTYSRHWNIKGVFVPRPVCNGYFKQNMAPERIK